MGCFSWRCAKTGLPIQEYVRRGRYEATESLESDVLALYANGGLIRGRYAGYGRIGDADISDAMGGTSEPRLVLAAFYEGEKYADLPRNGFDPAQGMPVFDAFNDAMFGAAQLGEIDTWQYPARMSEVCDLYQAGQDCVSDHLFTSEIASGPALGAVRDLRQSLNTYGAPNEGREDRPVSGFLTEAHEEFERLLADVTSRLRSPLALPARAIVVMLESIGEAVEIAASETVLAAWRRNEPAAAPDWLRAVGFPDAPQRTPRP